jgi:hypothetical protein
MACHCHLVVPAAGRIASVVLHAGPRSTTMTPPASTSRSPSPTTKMKSDQQRHQRRTGDTPNLGASASTTS